MQYFTNQFYKDKFRSYINKLHLVSLFALHYSNHKSITYNTIWSALVPSKVQPFLWKIVWNRAPTLEIIQSFYPHISLCPNISSLGLPVAESNVHLFFHCPFIWKPGENSYTWTIFVGWGRTMLCTVFLVESHPDYLSSRPYLGCMEGTNQVCFREYLRRCFFNLGIVSVFCSELV